MPVNATNKTIDLIAPNFRLLSVDGNFYELSELLGPNGTVIAFICNHCPYVIKIIDKFVYESSQLQNIGISTIAIMSNDVKNYPEDSYENMKLFSKKHKFSFQYLYDENQNVAKNYNAICTPDIYGFNKNKFLKYRGRIDSGIMNDNKNIKRELYYAMEMISKINEGPKVQYNSFGCSIKWIVDE